MPQVSLQLGKRWIKFTFICLPNMESSVCHVDDFRHAAVTLFGKTKEPLPEEVSEKMLFYRCISFVIIS